MNYSDKNKDRGGGIAALILGGPPKGREGNDDKKDKSRHEQDLHYFVEDVVKAVKHGDVEAVAEALKAWHDESHAGDDVGERENGNPGKKDRY